MELGASLLLIAAVFQLFDNLGLQAVATGAIRSLGDTHMAMLVNLAGHWFLGLPVACALCFPARLRRCAGLWMGLSLGLIVQRRADVALAPPPRALRGRQDTR